MSLEAAERGEIIAGRKKNEEIIFKLFDSWGLLKGYCL